MTKKDLYELNSKFSNLDIDSFKELVSFSENKNEKLIDSDKESDQFYEDSFEPFIHHPLAPHLPVPLSNQAHQNNTEQLLKN